MLVAAAGLAGCTSQAGIDAQPARLTFTTPLNYQQAYANLYRGARTCLASAGGINVDGQLYSELGYGEVSVNGGGYMIAMEGRVTKDDAGSQVAIKTGFPGWEGIAPWARYWTTTDSVRCPQSGFSETPPA